MNQQSNQKTFNKTNSSGRKYIFIGVLFIAALTIIFAITASSQSNEDKVKAFNVSIRQESEKNYKKAIETLMQKYENNKDDYLYNLRLGWLHYLNADYDNSIKYYTAAGNLKPFSIEFKLGLTLPFAAKEKWDEVKKLYEDILKLDAKNYTANLRLGQIYLNNQNYQEAKKYLEVVHNLYPGEYEPNLSLGYAYYYTGNKTRAKELLTNALMLNPDDKLAKEGLNFLK
ncbi:MAG: tetratricopeptide repeat protein [Ignavibacterium album]|uniref:tetratricopeptide repeat protein n=1 Tax=Ignavibacterium album TaxID=591197 RepID=UPI0026F23C84|nr:tetratricopeptide repeat protein [Ignavibacterium album]MBI5660613.1 tetratricopeptide repeat protein [Ignavibacterium album]